MNVGNIPLFQGMTARMGYLNARQQVLAANIANADTPGFKSMDLKPMDFGSHLNAANQMLRTNPMHMGPGGGNATATIKNGKNGYYYERNPDDNSVSIDEEVTKVSQTQADYNMMISLYRKNIDMFRTAAGRSGG